MSSLKSDILKNLSARLMAAAAVIALALALMAAGCSPAEPAPAPPASTTGRMDSVEGPGVMARLVNHTRHGEERRAAMDGGHAGASGWAKPLC